MYGVILRRGIFWYYFENTEMKPEVLEEYKLPCGMLYVPTRRNLLFQVSYYHNRINVEMYHALADGTGALLFLKTLVYYYITIKHKEDFGENLPKLDYDASFSQRMDDSFLRNYSGDRKLDKIRINRAYHILGRRSIDNRMKVIEGEMSVKQVLEQAHRYDTTLTIYLTALFLKTIYMDMPARGRKLPVVLSVPVNLRTYFPSVTARNFFAAVNIGYDFSKSSDQLEDIIYRNTAGGRNNCNWCSYDTQEHRNDIRYLKDKQDRHRQQYVTVSGCKPCKQEIEDHKKQEHQDGKHRRCIIHMQRRNQRREKNHDGRGGKCTEQ
jgi:hypothetical protein